MNHGPDDPSSTGLDSDELALRSLLQEAVQEIAPRDGTLDHLRKAVPARRARKRQALVGMAAAALFIGTAVPALVHVSNSTGTNANPSIAGHGSDTEGGSGEGKGPDGGESTSGGTAGKTEDKGKGEQKEEDKGKGTGSGAGVSSGADPSATSAAGVPLCTAAELGSATGSADAADSVGTVYGTFRITNVSGTDCTVVGPGSISPTPQGAADPAKITTARHVAGDAAAALPDPSLEVSSLLLKPGSSYEVKFAWVPLETCPTTGENSNGDTGNPTPDPTPTDDTTTAGGTSTGDTGTSTQLVTEEGTADGSVIITNTAEGGAPSVSTQVSNACAGTVYWTGLLAGA
ncbi:hypothetical protein [Streptomyces resistomycificus]|uniref:DUF4232 domain-containing protein n=1 Tax=Streptomyces resistomycificus TaxID=67356 RepID=A0A0L8LYW3_9ACTN|nr:hypothetical protein [Streptomyces resistomycificus]KOG43245.1 hypothetical protein ADK37_02310 [Streptomyces resistomycificus]KUN98073.1 hypothetical protein AQJ84_15345 [Streptomyces resistomycificus]